MSASPTTQSAKRPLEDPSSPNGQAEQPDAKRPAIEKVVKEEEAKTSEEPTTETESPEASTNGTNGVKKEETKTEESTPAAPVEAASQHVDESAWIHIRSVISSAEAATVIGKGGENVTRIRQMSGAKCTVSDYQKGAVERILTVSGAVEAVAKAFGLIIRTLNNEPLDAPSTPQSKQYPLRLLVPHILIGAIIGKGGSRIREIQEQSGARLNASESCLPLSTERQLIVLGVADAVHIATYWVGTTLLEQLTQRFGGPAASAYATRSGGPAGVIPGGMQVVPYVPQPAGGSYGHPDHLRHREARSRANATPAPQYGQPAYGAQGAAVPQAAHYGGTPVGAYGGVGPQQPHAGHAGPVVGHGAAPVAGAPVVPGQPLTQQIYIPNDMVGAIIGKGGQKINEIRQLSGSVIKINEPQDNSNERLVTITGTAECNQMALYMLYSRLESEKHRI